MEFKGDNSLHHMGLPCLLDEWSLPCECEYTHKLKGGLSNILHHIKIAHIGRNHKQTVEARNYGEIQVHLLLNGNALNYA